MLSTGEFDVLLRGCLCNVYRQIELEIIRTSWLFHDLTKNILLGLN